MGMRILSSSVYDGYMIRNNNEPDPKLFSIKEVYEVNNHLVTLVNYPNATNFEGNKVLIFENMNEAQLREIKVLDPHFSENGLSPFARFEPTAKGIEMAIELCKIIKKVTHSSKKL